MSTVLLLIGLICLIVIMICIMICICVLAKYILYDDNIINRRENQLKSNQRKQLPITDGDCNVNTQPVMKGKTVQVSLQGQKPVGTAIEMTSQTSENTST